MRGFGTNTAGAAGGFGTNTAGAAGGFGTNTAGTAGGFGTNTAGAAGGFGTNTAGAAGGFGTNTAGTAGGFGTNTAGTAGGFGTSTAGTAGGFGTNTAGAAGGFGTNTAGAAGGFGTNTAGTAGGFGTNTAGTAGGFGTNTAGAAGGFGTNTAGTAGGFGTNTAGTAGGFGTSTAGTAGGFGTNTAGAAGGFGTNTAGAAGGFGTNTAGTAGGFGTSTAGAAGGFGSTLGGQTQLPPYKGIKGPGFSTDWARSVNFSTLRDDVLFEELPPLLQQHLMELHTFIQAEREAKRFVETFLTDSMGPPPTGDSSSYKELQKKLCKLTTGENAVDGIRVDCFEREVHGRHLSMLLEKCEEEVIEYSKNVWEPLAEGFTHRCSGNRAELPSELFHRCLRDIQSRMEEVSAAVRELELAVVPNSQRQKRVTDADNTNANAATEASSPGGLFPRYTSEMSPLDTTAGLRQSVASHPIAQMNATLSNELATLLNLAAWTSRLHTRADAARDLFAHLYGTSEAEVLLAQQQRQIPVGPKRPFSLRSSEKSSFSDVDYDTIGDIHRRSVGLDRLGALGNGERRMQYDVLLERQHQALAPASTTTVITATTTTPGFSVPAVGGAAATTAGTAGSTAASAPVGGFGLSTTSTGGFGSTSKTSGLSGATTFKSGRT